MKNSILTFMVFAMLAVNCILVILGIVEDNEKKLWKYLKYCGILSMVSFLLIIADIFFLDKEILWQVNKYRLIKLML